MDLEIVGRHALLFDDDATAEVVNSVGSLVSWAAVGAADLLLDRHDVRHLLDRVPPRPRRSYSAALLAAPSPDGVSEAELDRERFLDLPADDDGSRDAAPSGINLVSVVPGSTLIDLALTPGTAKLLCDMLSSI
jgi:hypothetical protein